MNGQLIAIMSFVGVVVGGISVWFTILYNIFDLRDRFFNKPKRANITLFLTSQEATIQRNESILITRGKYPALQDINPYIAEIQLTFTNNGDLDGFVRVLSVKCRELYKLGSSAAQGKDYAIIQGRSKYTYDLLLRNIPAANENFRTITLDITVEWGGTDMAGKKENLFKKQILYPPRTITLRKV